jgi:hypothetical protein
LSREVVSAVRRPARSARGLRLLGAAIVALVATAAPALAADDRPRPVLATGDSMIQYVDVALDQRLERRVISDARIGTGISKPLQLDWPRYAAEQVGRLEPAATVMFVGANDGFDMTAPDGARVRCCGKGWRIELARRASGMMGTYARDGAAKVYWLTLPQAREGFFREVYPAVNAALRRASREHADDVRLIRLNDVFTPRGRFRETMRWKGRTVVIRQRDGIHLSPAGADIAASLVVDAMRADGLR